MSQLVFQRNLRILVIDDQENIHDDYRKIVAPRPATTAELDAAMSDFLGAEESSDAASDLGFELDSAFQGEDGLRMVQRALDEGRPYAMAFVDIRMPPGWDGIETVLRIWEIDTEILIVLCSAHSDYSWEQMVEKLGRTDRFLILKKPFDNIEVRQFAMALTERWSLARTDSLTGILNRRSLQEHLQREWARSVRHETPLSCVMLDLDFFKKINDVEGHQTGDAVLKAVAAAIQGCCRGSDLLFRYGGEEFCVVLPQTDVQGAVAWAERARESIAATRIPCDDRTLHVTASIGVAERQTDTRSAEALVDRADEALRIAKDAGRNRVVRMPGFDGDLSTAPSTQQAPGLLQGVSASDVMSRHVATLGTDTTVGEAARFFLERGLNSAPVVDDDGKMTGIVSEKDVLGVMLATESWNWPVSKISQANVVSYDEQTPIEKIFDFLSRVTMRRVVIVRGGRPVGSISSTSLLRWFADWVLSQSSGLASAPGPSRSISKARLVEAARSLAARAAHLAEQASTHEEAHPLCDEIYGPMSDDVATIHDLFREIVSLSDATPRLPSNSPLSSVAQSLQGEPVTSA
jgi:diguanylate cyclase (GGDEF)-like protein